MHRHAGIAWASLLSLSAAACTQHPVSRFEVSFPASLSDKPITGRVFVTVFTRGDVEPRVAAYQSARVRVGRVPFFAHDVDSLKPGEEAIVDTTAESFPLQNLRDLPAGDYYVQA